MLALVSSNEKPLTPVPSNLSPFQDDCATSVSTEAPDV